MNSQGEHREQIRAHGGTHVVTRSSAVVTANRLACGNLPEVNACSFLESIAEILKDYRYYHISFRAVR
jgi:hypothetical protein